MTSDEDWGRRIRAALVALVQTIVAEGGSMEEISRRTGRSVPVLREWTRPNGTKAPLPRTAQPIAVALRPLHPGLAIELARAATCAGLTVDWADERGEGERDLLAEMERLRAEIVRLTASLRRATAEHREMIDRIHEDHLKWAAWFETHGGREPE